MRVGRLFILLPLRIWLPLILLRCHGRCVVRLVVSGEWPGLGSGVRHHDLRDPRVPLLTRFPSGGVTGVGRGEITPAGVRAVLGASPAGWTAALAGWQ